MNTHLKLLVVKPFPRFTLGVILSLLAGATIAPLLGSQSAIAQLVDNSAAPLKDFQNQDNQDPFSNRGGGGSASSVFDLIHRATLGNSRSLDDFNQEQKENLDDAAAAFRANQLRQLNQQSPQTAPGAAGTVEPAATISAPTAK